MMKKKYLFSAFAAFAAATAFTSCSNDELEGANIAGFGSSREAISFATKGGTRAGTTVTSLNEFTATALLDDNSVLFKDKVYQYADGAFHATQNDYWPLNRAVSFFCINEPGTRSVDKNNIPKYSYSEWSGEKDIVAATVINSPKVNPVQLVFSHITSQISVSVEPKDKTEKLSYLVTSIKMEAPSTGTYSFADATGGTGTWDIDNNATSEYSFRSYSGETKTFDQSGNYTNNDVYWNILPATSGSLKFTIEYKVYADNRLVADFTGRNRKECTVENPSLVAGKKYNFNLIVPHDLTQVIFNSSVGTWNDGNNSSNEVSSITVRDAQEMVDLGLPSGLLWAAGNVGAEKETDDGLYFAWGETTGYTKDSGHVFSYENYKYKGQIWEPTLNDGILPLQYDAAHSILGGNYRMPTSDDFIELYQNCNYKFIANYQNTGKPANLFVSKNNGNFIVFMDNVWTSTNYSGVESEAHEFNSNETYSAPESTGGYSPEDGMQVRAVCPK